MRGFLYWQRFLTILLVCGLAGAAVGVLICRAFEQMDNTDRLTLCLVGAVAGLSIGWLWLRWDTRPR
jgi:uncharacterized membrane protein YeaQ/YmgE (transglycosylase-associated protein family)